MFTFLTKYRPSEISASIITLVTINLLTLAVTLRAIFVSDDLSSFIFIIKIIKDTTKK